MRKKLLSIFTLLCLAVTSAWADENGSCGTSVTYSYVESTYTLTISGLGDMANYEYNSQPWNSYKDDITSVVIESGVTSIGQNAFAYCSKLTSVTIPASVTTIGDHAFKGCEGLTSITIPASVTSIGEYAFWKCAGLTSIAIPASVTSIGASAFKECPDLTSIVIPASVTSIGNSAFESCSKLASVTVFAPIAPTTCTLGSAAFNDCTNLQIYVPSDLVDTFKKTTGWSAYRGKITAIGGNCGATATWSLNSTGVLTISGSGAMTDLVSEADQPWKGYRTSITSVVIESGVTSIGNWAFRDCTGLTSVTIPASVTTIGNHAFEGCKGLTSITIPASVTSIGNSAFKSCYNLTSVTVYSTSCTLGTQAFDNWASGLQIKVFSDLVGIYKGKENWSTYTDKITAIGGNCGATATWSLSSTGVLTISGSGAMTDLVSKDDQPWKGYRTSITSVVIGSGVTSIGYHAFEGCTGLTSVTFDGTPSLETIGISAFDGNINLTSIEIPASVTSIGQSAFSACSGLASITFASGSKLKTIGESVFYNCSNTNLTSIEIPASVTTIGNWAFMYCRYLTSVTVYSTSCTLGTQAFDGCTNLANIYVFSDLEETFKTSTTGWSAYSGIITAMTNPHGKCGASDHESDVRWVLTGTSPNYTLTIMKVGSTGAMANYGGDNQPWKDYRSNIKSVVIVNGVTTIGDGAFMACSNLATVTFDGNSQPVIFNQYAFCGCGFTSVTIPSNVTTIGNFTFSGCPNLTEVNIGKGVTSIEHHAFNSCPKLTTITVDTKNTKYDSRDNCNAIIETTSNTLVLGCKDTFIPNTVTSIGDAAFWKCAGLTSIAIPASVTSIGASAFKECPDLTSVTFATGSQLTSIGVLAFYDCKSLASIEIPASVTSIGIGVFNYCENLTTITVNTENTTYDSRDNCNAIIETTPKKLVAGCKNSTIPDGVTSIGKGAFRTIGLTSVTIPVSVTSIEDEAFYNCTNLGKTYVLPTTVPTMGSNVFKYCNDENFAIIVPAAKYDDYCSASGWSSYQLKMKKGYSVTCPDVITATGVGPLVQQGETVTLSGTGDIPTGYIFGGYSVKDADGATVNVTETEGVYTFAMPAADVTVTTTWKMLTLADLAELAIDEKMQDVVKDGKLKMTVTPKNKYWTLACGVDLLVPEGVKVYKARMNSAGTKVELTEIDATTLGGVLKANNGVLIASTPGQTYDLVVSPNNSVTTLSSADAKSYGTDNELEPVLEDTHFTTEDYFILTENKFVMVDVSKDTKVPAGKAVLKVPAGSVKSRSMDIDGDETTGIHAGMMNAEEEIWYNLQGQRISKPTRKGVYILNGKKVRK